MTKDEIRAIALEVAKELLDEPLNIGQAEHYTDFATRFLASIAEKAEPVARLHIRLEDDGLEARVEVLNGERLQVSDSPVNVFLHPAIEPAPQRTSRDLQHEHTMNQFKEVCHGRNCTANKAQPTHSDECKADHDNAVGSAPLPDEVAQMVARLHVGGLQKPENDRCIALIERLAQRTNELDAVIRSHGIPVKTFTGGQAHYCEPNPIAAGEVK